MLVGTSLGRCLISILKGEVREEDVALIVTSTDAPTYDNYMDVVRSYYKHGNRHSRHYDFTGLKWDDVQNLADWLWYRGKIHQPRTFGREANGLGHVGVIWMDIVPVPTGDNPSVMEAWEQYRTLAILAE